MRHKYGIQRQPCDLKNYNEAQKDTIRQVDIIHKWTWLLASLESNA
jgi:hypothetical protein